MRLAMQSNILLRFKTQKVSQKNVVKPRIRIDCLKICPVISLTCPRISVTTCRLRSGQTRTFSFLRNLFLAPPQRMYELLTEIVGTATLAAFWLIFLLWPKINIINRFCGNSEVRLITVNLGLKLSYLNILFCLTREKACNKWLLGWKMSCIFYLWRQYLRFKYQGVQKYPI